MKYSMSALLVVILAPAPSAAAENDQVTFGPAPQWATASEPMAVPDDADGAVFLRRQDSIVHLSETGQQYYQGQMVRILHPQALQAGNLSLVWNPASCHPIVHHLRIHRGDRVIDMLENATFEVLRREDQLETAMLDGLLTAVMRVPDLRVGDDLEFAYTVPSHDPTFPETNSGILFLVQSPPKGRIKLELSWEDGQKPATRITADLKDRVRESKKAITSSFDNPEALTVPTDAPPRFSWMRVIEYTDFASWSDVSKQFHSLFESATKLSATSALREEANDIMHSHSTELERAVAALKLVQQQVRYVYVGLNGGNFRPASADETWERRYGDCKGKTVMLLALLEALGIEAEPVLANNDGGDDGLDARLPSPNMFDHVLVRATIGGKKYWLDGTMPDVVGLREDPILPYRWVLPLRQSGTELERLPQKLPTLPMEMGLYEIDARAGFDQPARVIQTTVTRGIQGVLEYARFSAVSAHDLQSTLRDAFVGGGQWYDIEDISYRYDRQSDASILTVTGTAPVNWDEDDHNGYDLTLPGGGFSPPKRHQRPATQDQSAPYYSDPTYSCHATTVRLPKDTDLKHWSHNSTFDTMLYGRVYYREMEKTKDRTIRMVRGSKVINPEISAELADRDNRQLPDFDDSMARITYAPSWDSSIAFEDRDIPAVYEFDWISDSSHCLPSDLAGKD